MGSGWNRGGDTGVPASSGGRACGPSDLSQSSLSQPKALVPNAESCPTCHGEREWKSQGETYPCYRCEAPDEDTVQFALSRLTHEQKRRIMFNQPSMAEQPVSAADWDEILVPARCYVERDDALIEDGEVVIPASMIWFGGGGSHYYGDGGDWHLCCYLNGLGMILRERIAASGMSAFGQDPEEGLEAKPASPAPQGDAQ